jgi:O-antigen ligase
LRSAALFQDRSGQNRLTLWKYTTDYNTKSAKNFFVGAGLRSFFERVQKPVNDFKKIEPLIYPHNILLNFWSEIGLFGILGFVGIFVLCFKKNISNRNDNFFRAAAACALVIFFVHGLVDVPYFKNDLAFIWWFVFGIIYS